MQTTIYTIIAECAKNTVQKLRYMQTTIYTINSTDITTFDGYVLWINLFAYKLLSLTGKNMPECISIKLIAILIKMMHNGAERQHGNHQKR